MYISVGAGAVNTIAVSTVGAVGVSTNGVDDVTEGVVVQALLL